MLTASNATSHATAILSVDPFNTPPNLRVEVAQFQTGEVVSGPTVGFGQIAQGTGHTTSGWVQGTVEPEVRTPLDLTDQWPALAGNLRVGNLTLSPEQITLCATGSLKVDDNLVVQEPSGGSAQITNAGTQESNIGAYTHILGNVWSSAPVVLRDGARIDGFLDTTSTVTKQNNITVAGGILSSSGLALPDIRQLQIAFPSPIGDVILEPDQQRTLNPGSYANVTLKPRAKLSLLGGTYYWQNWDFEPQAQLLLNKTNGPIFIYVRSSLIYRGTLVDQGGAPGDLFLGYMGSGTAFIEAPFVGTVVAPTAKLELASSSVGYKGAFCGKDLEAHAGTTITHLPFSAWPSFN